MDPSFRILRGINVKINNATVNIIVLILRASLHNKTRLLYLEVFAIKNVMQILD